MFSRKDKPYFMKNKEWYYYDTKEELFKPTQKAPPKAVKSIEQFNKKINYVDKNGVRHIVDY